eukprot:jgi/Botrbrau1/14516/Bobra.0223s0006.1
MEETAMREEQAYLSGLECRDERSTPEKTLSVDKRVELCWLGLEGICIVTFCRSITSFGNAPGTCGEECSE